jgi:histidyl-tRNA synthetase
MRFYAEAGLTPSIALNSIGHPDDSCRIGYSKLLIEYLRENEQALDPEDRARIDANPLRTFDSKNERTQAVMRGAPVITDHICAECRDHFGRVQEALNDIGIDFALEPRLVRGLDYYTRTTFEFLSGNLGSQNAVGGGGRYDGLAEALGGDALSAIGFSLGVDRIILAGEAAERAGGDVTVYFVALNDAARRVSFRAVAALRRAGTGADMDYAGRGMKGQMKDAARSGARWAAIIGDDELAAGEVTLRDLESGEQQRVSLDDVRERVMRP